jgi:hypothetical protein
MKPRKDAPIQPADSAEFTVERAAARKLDGNVEIEAKSIPRAEKQG